MIRDRLYDLSWLGVLHSRQRPKRTSIRAQHGRTWLSSVRLLASPRQGRLRIHPACPIGGNARVMPPPHEHVRASASSVRRGRLPRLSTAVCEKCGALRVFRYEADLPLCLFACLSAYLPVCLIDLSPLFPAFLPDFPFLIAQPCSFSLSVVGFIICLSARSVFSHLWLVVVVGLVAVCCMR